MNSLKVGTSLMISDEAENWMKGHLQHIANSMVEAVLIESWPENTTTSDLVALKEALGQSLFLAAEKEYEKTLKFIRSRVNGCCHSVGVYSGRGGAGDGNYGSNTGSHGYGVGAGGGVYRSSWGSGGNGGGRCQDPNFISGPCDCRARVGMEEKETKPEASDSICELIDDVAERMTEFLRTGQ